MKECDLTLEEVVEQVQKFFDLGLTSQYRDGQYPPYFINDKKKKEFQAAVRGLLRLMDMWLSGGMTAEAESPPAAPSLGNTLPPT